MIKIISLCNNYKKFYLYVKKERTKSEILVECHDSLQDEHLKLANKLLNTKDKLTDTQYDLLSSLDKIAKQRYVNFEASQELSAALEQIRILEEKIQKSVTKIVNYIYVFCLNNMF